MDVAVTEPAAERSRPGVPCTLLNCRDHRAVLANADADATLLASSRCTRRLMRLGPCGCVHCSSGWTAGVLTRLTAL